MSNSKLIAIWGSPSSGKTITSMKVAKELTEKNKNVAVILTDTVCPAISTIIPGCDVKSRTLGNILSKPSINQDDILANSIPFPKNEYLCLLGYKNGDNIFTYSDFLKERVIDLFVLLKHVVDYVLVDCASLLTVDSVSTIALEQADVVLRHCGSDLKSISYFSSFLPLIADRKFKSEKHVKILSNVKLKQDERQFSSYYNGISYTIPFIKGLEEQFLSATLMNKLTGKEADKYQPIIKKIVSEVIEVG